MAKQTIETGDCATFEVKIGRTTKLNFHVEVLEKSGSFGRERYLVKPVSGSGKAVVEKIKKCKI